MGRVAYRMALAVVFIWYFAICLHGIANYWQWGHNGYNGAAFSQGARNSLRFGISGQAIYYFDREPPTAEHIFTSHPQMLHHHLIAAYGLLGMHEWAGRLVPASYSLGTAVLLFLLVRRLWGRAMGLLTITLHALTPLNLIFANMIDHEQGGIFWCLCLVAIYLRWLETQSRKTFYASLIVVTIAVQFDWPAYYIALLLAVHAFFTGVERRPGWIRWRPEYTWVAAFSATVLLNAAAYFAWIHATAGSLDGMIHSFRSRSSNHEGYLSLLWSRSLDLQGGVLLSLLGLWVMRLLVRTARRQLTSRDLLPAAFLFAQAVSSLLFKDAGFVHSYWTYYASPAIAIGGAEVLLWAWQSLSSFLSNISAHRRLAQAAPALLIALLLLFQGRFAWAQLEWGFRTGAAAYIEPYYDQFEEILWAKEVSACFSRDSVFYVLHSSIWARRVEFDFYLDAPMTTGGPVLSAEQLKRALHVVLLLDLRGVPENARLNGPIAGLARHHRTLVWDRRFVAIDGGSSGGTLEGFRSKPQPASIWWKWLVNPDRPPVRWESDDDLDAARNALGLSAREG